MAKIVDVLGYTYFDGLSWCIKNLKGLISYTPADTNEPTVNKTTGFVQH